MNAKTAKLWRWGQRVSRGLPWNDVQYQWIQRPDGSVFRQLAPFCGRAVYQLTKGKGLHRVHVKQ